MKKSYRIEELCCANCAAKIETAVNKLPEVDRATLNFMTLRLTIESETTDWGRLMEKVCGIFSKIEPESRVVLP
ncbi:MAG: cation transporter [Oscillospiraceae bacterium]|nr:cation transporter [Oscillospiraceae bacterium]